MKILIFLLLAGCATFHPTANRTNVDITVIKTDNLRSPRNGIKRLGTHYCYTDKKCTIWIPTGDSACAKEVEAHERKHVKDGLFHKGAFILENC